ncbi:MAG: putative phosphohydrolase [Clostridia bacterium]|nr:putative phosphohydrolase [Clostridia bacterium]
MVEIRSFYDYIEELESVQEVHKMKNYVQHGKSSTYSHCKIVAYYSYCLAIKINLKLDYASLVKGAFLHDFYLYDWHIKNDGHNLHAFTHPKKAVENASKNFQLNSKEINIIESHMWPLTINKIPKSKEAIIVCIVDKFCAIIEAVKIRNELTF